LADLEGLKNSIVNEVRSLERRIVEVSETIHSSPELGLREYKASELLSSELERCGFKVERGIADMSTAFRATLTTGRAGPHLAYLAEYDALPQIGHGCGHNIVGTSAVFSAIALGRVADRVGGRITVLGTPDEEGSGGKIRMVKAGCFEDVDVAMMSHPMNYTSPWQPSVGVDCLTVEFTGKAAHYSTPHRGVNALDGAVLVLAGLNFLRHGFRNDVIYGYTIDHGGVSPGIVPEKAAARLWIKSTDLPNLAHVLGRVKAYAEGVAESIGAQVRIEHPFPVFEESIPNLTLIHAVSQNLTRLGIPFRPPEESSRSLAYVSTDYGNVSHVVPSVSAVIAIGPQGLTVHTEKFREAAVSKAGHEALLAVTKVMAMTGVDVLCQPAILEAAKSEFLKYKESGFADVPFTPVYD